MHGGCLDSSSTGTTDAVGWVMRVMEWPNSPAPSQVSAWLGFLLSGLFATPICYIWSFLSVYPARDLLYLERVRAPLAGHGDRVGVPVATELAEGLPGRE